MSNFSVIDLQTYVDERGLLTVLEGDLPFQASRTYWIYGADGQVRGGHRHVVTRQAMVCLAGEVILHLNNGEIARDVVLTRPSQCLIVEPEDWHTMSFANNAVLLVFASHGYSRADYIETPYV